MNTIFTTGSIFTLSRYIVELLLKEEPDVNDVGNLLMCKAFRTRKRSGMFEYIC